MLLIKSELVMRDRVPNPGGGVCIAITFGSFRPLRPLTPRSITKYPRLVFIPNTLATQKDESYKHRSRRWLFRA